MKLTKQDEMLLRQVLADWTKLETNSPAIEAPHLLPFVKNLVSRMDGYEIKTRNLKEITVQLLVNVDVVKFDETKFRHEMMDMCANSKQKLQFRHYSVGNSGMTQAEYDDGE